MKVPVAIETLKLLACSEFLIASEKTAEAVFKQKE